MKAIFLDYDGVLNRVSEGYSTPARAINGILTMAEPELVYRLNLVVDRTDAELVLSSSWRYYPEWKEAMKLSGIVKTFHSRTGKEGEHRGHQIQAWLDIHKPEKYAIIDDNDDMLPPQQSNFFKTDPSQGLSQEIANAVEKHLS